MKTLAQLTEQIKTGTWQDRRQACGQLVLLGNADVVHPLVYALDDPDAGVREAAFNALGKLNHPLAAGPMMEHLAWETEEPVRLAGIHALGVLRNPNAVPSLAAVLKDDLASIRLAATQALGNIKDVRALDDLISRLEDSSLYVRAAASESLGLLKNAGATRHLIKMLGDVEPLVREKSLEALRRLGEYPLVTAYALAFFGSQTDTSAMKSLARHGDVRLVSALLSRLDTPWTKEDQKDRIADTLKAIYKDSTEALDRIFCIADLMRFTPQRIEIEEVGKIHFVGCRTCGSTGHAIPATTVFAVVDEQLKAEWKLEEDVLRVNWFKHQALFDFNRVEIGVADDKTVTQFCLLLSNDTDPGRLIRCYDMICDVLPSANISNNTLQILKRTFAMVKDGRGRG